MRSGTVRPFLLGGLISPAPPPSVAPLCRRRLAPPLTLFGSGSPVPAGAGIPLPRRAPPPSSTALTLRENICCWCCCCCPEVDDESAAVLGPGVVHRGGMGGTAPPPFIESA
jgi:hypothetical protein